MSAFLGPIHYRLYEKIKYQEKINKELLKKYDENKSKEIDSKYGKIAQGELDAIIDQERIHQWLSNQVEIVENRLAHLVEEIEEDKYKDIVKIFYNEGEIAALGKTYTNPQEAFTELNKHLLDKMPCDKGVSIISQTDEELIFGYNPDIHQAFKSYQNFMTQRILWIKGFLSKSKILVEQLENTTVKLKMED